MNNAKGLQFANYQRSLFLGIICKVVTCKDSSKQQLIKVRFRNLIEVSLTEVLYFFISTIIRSSSALRTFAISFNGDSNSGNKNVGLDHIEVLVSSCASTRSDDKQKVQSNSWISLASMDHVEAWVNRCRRFVFRVREENWRFSFSVMP